MAMPYIFKRTPSKTVRPKWLKSPWARDWERPNRQLSLTSVNEREPAARVSDFGTNTGLVIGAEIGGDLRFLGRPVALTIDGEIGGGVPAAAMLGGPFGGVRVLFELGRDRQPPLASGRWLSTGAVTGVHPVRPGAEVGRRFGEGMRIRCRIRR